MDAVPLMRWSCTPLASNYLREHILPTSSIHYQIESAGDVANGCWNTPASGPCIRDPKRENMMAVYERALKIAQGASLMAEVDYKVTMSGLHEILVNRYGANALHANMELVGPINTPTKSRICQHPAATGKPEVGLDGSIMPPSGDRTDHPGRLYGMWVTSWIVPRSA